MPTAEGRDGTTWEGGSLDELLAFLAESSLSARIVAWHPTGRLGHIDVIAGGVADATAGDKQGDAAVAALGKREGAQYQVELRLPHPTKATLDPPGDREGPLATRPVASIMRYCEEFVLSGALVVEQKGEVARIVYRRGEIMATLVDGADAPERLPDVMGWSEGTFHIDVVAPELPRRTPAKPKPAGPHDVSTVLGYPVPGMKPPGAEPSPAQPITVSGPRLGERPTPRVPLAVATPDPASSRPTPRGAPGVMTSAAPAPIPLRTVTGTAKMRAAVVPAPRPATAGAVPQRPSHANVGQEEPLRLPETGFLAQPVIVHVFVGVALGLLGVAAYWAYLHAGGTPLQIG
jgi:hypothetical protein